MCFYLVPGFRKPICSPCSNITAANLDMYRYPNAPHKPRKMVGMKDAIARNQVFLDAVIEFQDRTSPFPIDEHGAVGEGPSRTSARQVGKVNTTLHQCMRDWSDEGEEERRQSYGPVIEELERLCPVNPDLKGTRKVLVPGAGLGRLTLEIVSRGYGCAGTCQYTAVSPL